jgi:uncharacterized protein (DUF305 family)
MKLPRVAPGACGLTLVLAACLFGANTLAQQLHHGHGHALHSAPAPFVASTGKPFAVLMADAMAVMDDGMQRAPLTGVAEHDFVAMMIPHHQGAIDMAKALLAYSSDRELRNLAQGIITEQQNEIKVMQAWLQRHQATGRAAPATPTKED